MIFKKENFVVINAGKLRETIMDFARNHGYTYTHVCRKMMHINTSDLLTSIERYNHHNPGTDNTQVLGYVTKSKFKEIMYGYNAVFAPFHLIYPDFNDFIVHPDKNIESLAHAVMENKIAESSSALVLPESAFARYKNQIKCGDIQVSSRKTKLLQVEIGKTSNLITDMIIQGASEEEILTAVKYSRYLLDFDKLREKIQELHKKYHRA